MWRGIKNIKWQGVAIHLRWNETKEAAKILEDMYKWIYKVKKPSNELNEKYKAFPVNEEFFL
jgi:hypothetical protein